MATIFDEKHRNVIPRWRNSSISLISKEFESISFTSSKSLSDSFLLEKNNLWLEKKNIATAAEFVFSAFIYGDFIEAKSAAEYILKHQDRLPLELIHIAKQIIGGNQNPIVLESPKNILDHSHSIKYNRIRILKKRINTDPRNAIARVDIAREYSVLGEYEKALKNILVALSLNKENRFILRSSSRFLIHIGLTDHAHFILNNANRTVQDPWLLAAEIATSAVIGRPSKLFKTGAKLLESGNYPKYHLSELAAALGAQEYYFGSQKKVKKFFRRAKEKPTENAIAQIVWTNNQLGLRDLELESLQTSQLYEAQARNNFAQGKWADSVEEGIRWFNDQPFSRSPAHFISYVTGGILEEYEMSIKLCEIALEANRNDFTLLNNISFALASNNNSSGADSYFRRIEYTSLEESQRVVYNATKGLIHFRKGEFTDGLYFYNKSIDLANRYKVKKYGLLASMYLLREQSIAGLQSDISIEDLTEKFLKKIPKSEHIEILKIIANLKKVINLK